MNTKERILAILEEHRGTAVSGQALAQAAGVSRTAVWKAMEQLRQDGHRIQGATNRGYMLAPDSGVLCRETVLPYITAQVALVTPGAVDSTNNVAKQLAQQGAPHGTVVLSHKQTAGRGRMGRRFESPEGGIWGPAWGFAGPWSRRAGCKAGSSGSTTYIWRGKRFAAFSPRRPPAWKTGCWSM